MSLLGSDASIEPMLEAFRNDPSKEVREGAGCGIAQSGMLTKGQRMKAVPTLIKFAEDPAIDANTRSWVFQALRDISGENLGSDPSTWRIWWMENAPR
jgi:HEAT repeat protein